MITLAEAYQEKDRSRLHIGWGALEEIEMRVSADKEAGLSAPPRTQLSEILEELSEEYQQYHSSKESCRSYIRDSVRMARYFDPDKIAELEKYHLTTSHLIACIIRGESWPAVDETETNALLTWAIDNEASPADIWEYRKGREEELTEEAKASRRVVKSAEHYLEITAPENGFVERRKACNDLIKIFEEV